MGCVTQVGEQALNVGRVALLVAGWPETVAASTVDRQCGSSLQAALQRRVRDLGGAARRRRRRGSRVDVARSDGLESRPRGLGLHQREDRRALADRAAGHLRRGDRRGVGPDRGSELDAYSFESHRRALAAIDEGRFESEIVPIEVGGTGAAVLFGVDETPRRDTSLGEAGLARAGVQGGRRRDRGELEPDLRRLRRDAARRASARPSASASSRAARFVSFGLSGVDPYRMLHGNPQACERALERAGPRLGRHRRDRGERGVRLRRAPVPRRHRARTSAGRRAT